MALTKKKQTKKLGPSLTCCSKTCRYCSALMVQAVSSLGINRHVHTNRDVGF